jgi:cytidyltransferase-like protein
MTVQELVCELPKAVLMWYPFATKPFVVDSDNINEILSGELGGGYDYIVVTSVWEGLEKPEKLFSYLKCKLNKNGRLLVLMNNRLGLRYFCGDKDPYTGTVLDCLEDYINVAGRNNGRMYDKAQMKGILHNSGFECFQFFSVFPGLGSPSLICAEDYTPNEDLTNRIFPAYNSPKTVFLEERLLYRQLSENNMLHGMANAYLVECSLDGGLTDVNQVTSSLDRGRENALFTILYKSGVVEKRAAYPEGVARLSNIDTNHRELEKRGIGVVKGVLDGVSYRMGYMDAEVAQMYFRRILRTDVDKFLSEMDHFRDIIMGSSDIVSPDSGDGEGAVLRCGYLDMVPLNSFHVGNDFVLFDQEFKEENFPANLLLWRMVASYYSADLEAKSIYPMDMLLERYGLTQKRGKWQDMESVFLNSLKNAAMLGDYNRRTRMDRACMMKNRERMGMSATEYEKKFFDIFSGIQGSSLVLFGTGKYAKRFLDSYGRDFPVHAMIDNNSEKWGQKIRGIPVESPGYLSSIPKESVKVIICVRDYGEIAGQLEEMGIDNYSVYNPNRFYQTIPRTSIEVIDVNSTVNGVSQQCKKYHVGYVAGAFDMFHIGHLNLIRRAKEQCDYLIVGVMSDEKMYQLKNKYPVIPCNERLQVVAACRYADRVEELPTDRAGIRDAYHMFHFDCMFSGDDHSDNKYWLEDREYLRGLGSDIVFLPYTQETSSTMIKEKLDKI